MLVELGHEPARLEALQALDILDTPPEERFDRVVRLAQRLFDVPIAAMNLVDADRQWTKSGVGLETRELPRDLSVCSHVVARDDGPVVIPDARLNKRFADHPLVAGSPGIRFYAGQVLHAPDGQPVGTLCVIDHEPREVDQEQVDLLGDLAGWIEQELAIDADISAAAQVQQQLFPRTAPDLPGYQVAGECLPARNVGGDFYDWYVAGGQHQFVLGDVMGKGMAAALIAASVRSLLRGASRFNDLAEAVTRTGYIMEGDLVETGSFVTAFCVRLDPATGAFSYVDAGHGLSMVFESSGGLRRLLSGGLPLGAVPGDTWEAGWSVLQPGETLVMVSDGLLDFFDSPRDALEAVHAIIDHAPDAGFIVHHVTGLAETAIQSDDVTITVICRELQP